MDRLFSTNLRLALFVAVLALGSCGPNTLPPPTLAPTFTPVPPTQLPTSAPPLPSATPVPATAVPTRQATEVVPPAVPEASATPSKLALGTYRKENADGESYLVLLGFNRFMHSSSELVFGRYKTTSDEIEFSLDDGMPGGCQDIKGRYTWGMENSKLSLTAIQDDCAARKSDLPSGEWIKLPPPRGASFSPTSTDKLSNGAFVAPKEGGYPFEFLILTEHDRFLLPGEFGVITGKWTSNGNQVAFTEDGAVGECADPGLYTWALDDNTLTLTPVADECGARKYYFTLGGFSRIQ